MQYSNKESDLLEQWTSWVNSNFKLAVSASFWFDNRPTKLFDYHLQ